MKNKSKSFISIITFIVILFSAVLIWFMNEKSHSYQEPQEALLAIDKNLLLIPAYKVNGESLYFFIKDKDSLGASFVRKGILGWRAGMLSWGLLGKNSQVHLIV
ncbi:hypothetical protein [Neobacillus sp. PS3-40]|uniref:hypothetical protein n=1 Tax=Neobacillus sp. PS3-40 TaxID=3070679 RepID=UPI0027E13A7E|nr:hypothetical protein [Neobacillus sp. PS3-40]WML44133.1 hypothetical protein RCG20_20525 [Neobacillus sp. PS3-40]